MNYTPNIKHACYTLWDIHKQRPHNKTRTSWENQWDNVYLLMQKLKEQELNYEKDILFCFFKVKDEKIRS